MIYCFLKTPRTKGKYAWDSVCVGMCKKYNVWNVRLIPERSRGGLPIIYILIRSFRYKIIKLPVTEYHLRWTLTSSFSFTVWPAPIFNLIAMKPTYDPPSFIFIYPLYSIILMTLNNNTQPLWRTLAACLHEISRRG